MSLARVIDDQQKRIDWLNSQLESCHKTIESMFEKHETLFELIGDLVDRGTKNPNLEAQMHAVRITLLTTGFHMCCYKFDCECGDE